jgi:hypothetical protein
MPCAVDMSVDLVPHVAGVMSPRSRKGNAANQARRVRLCLPGRRAHSAAIRPAIRARRRDRPWRSCTTASGRTAADPAARRPELAGAPHLCLGRGGLPRDLGPAAAEQRRERDEVDGRVHVRWDGWGQGGDAERGAGGRGERGGGERVERVRCGHGVSGAAGPAGAGGNGATLALTGLSGGDGAPGSTGGRGQGGGGGGGAKAGLFCQVGPDIVDGVGPAAEASGVAARGGRDQGL